MGKTKIKHILNLYLKKLTIPKVSKFGVEDVYVKGIIYPDFDLGQVFVFTEPDITRNEHRKTIERIIVHDVFDSLQFVNQPPEDWSFFLNKLPLNPLDESLPFKEVIRDNERIRTFSESTDDGEFKWHQDNEDRLVSTTHKTDWMVQLDNELPIRLEVGKEILIPEGVWHRVIKGTGNLTVKVKFI